MAITRWEPFRGIGRWEPLRQIESLRDEMDHLFEQLRPVGEEEKFILDRKSVV